MLKRFLRVMSPVGQMVALWVQPAASRWPEASNCDALTTVSSAGSGFSSPTSRHYRDKRSPSFTSLHLFDNFSYLLLWR